MLIFSGPLAGHVHVAIGIALFSAIVVGIIVALTSSRPGMVAVPQESPAPKPP